MAMPEIEERQETEAPRRRPSWAAIGVGAALLLLALIGLALVGELNGFLYASLQVLPFLGLAVLASLGETRTWARWLAYLYLVGLGFIILGFSALFVFAAAIGTTIGGIGQASPAVLAAASQPLLTFLGVGLILLILSLLPLIPSVRRALDRVLPIRPASVSDTVGLSVVLMLAALPLAALAVLGGRPPLLELLRVPGVEEALAGRSPLQQQLELIYGLIWLLPVSLVVVGYPIRRSFRAALLRLGLVRPTARQVAIGLAAAVALVFAATGLDAAIAQTWEAFGWPRTESALFERLLGGLISPTGAVVIGVTAGIGEEVAIRGVLQPRVGILLSNLAFTSIHAYQYGFDGLLSVFLIGLVLGVLRKYTNTTTSAITHGTYDFILVMALSLGWG